MEFQKQSVNAFAGLDVNKRPEMIDDAQASDIENLRFDKLGYLVNRNGVEHHPLSMDRVVYSDIQGDLYPIGAIGLAEYVLSDEYGPAADLGAVEPYDATTMGATGAGSISKSDRFMVTYVRLPVNDGLQQTDGYNEPDRSSPAGDHRTFRYKAAILLSPLTGNDAWRDTFFFAPNGEAHDPGTYEPSSDVSSLWATVGARTIKRADDSLSSLQIYAPQRWMGEHNVFRDGDNNPKDANWIEHYATMRQYRKDMVISDLVNGDMRLIDESHEAEYAAQAAHYFSLRENAVVEFDPDDVVVDFGINGGGFNDGVKTGMGLYKFYLPRRRAEGTRDNFSPFFTGSADRSPTMTLSALTRSGVAGQTLVERYSMSYAQDCFILTELIEEVIDLIGDDAFVSSIAFNQSKPFVFTNFKTSQDIDDLWGQATLKNPQVKEEDATAADVYIWDDNEIMYFPCGGQDVNTRFLRYKDRTWDKSSSGSTKIVKLKTKAGVEQEVPLGVWRYRFVWYLGNGEYSAPSAELIVPDLLFSAIEDADLTDAIGTYERPFGLESGDDALRTGLKLDTAPADEFLNETSAFQGPIIFDGTTLTAYGQSFISIKEKLYFPDHKYAAQDSSTSGASWPTNWSTESLRAMGNVQVLATVFFPDRFMTMAGVACECAYTLSDGFDDLVADDYDDLKIEMYRSSSVPLTVPLFASPVRLPDESYSFNSAFTDDGICRVIWQNKATNSTLTGYDAAKPAYQVVFEGKHRFGYDNTQGWVTNSVAKDGKRVIFNVVPVQNAIDRNNTADDDVYLTRERREYRNMALSRGTLAEEERLLRVMPDVPAEVVTRMLLTGTGEFTLCDHGDLGSWISQYSRYPADNANHLELTDTRQVEDLDNGAGNWYTTEGGIPASPARMIKFDDQNPPNYNARFTNVRVVISGRGERLMIPEQLSAYFPASLLFQAPRVKLTIPADRVPKRAKKLLIFRTHATHDNDWQPHLYGLVKSVDLIRDENNVLTGDHADNVVLLDDVKSKDLDFSYDLSQYEGATTPLRSRFNLPLNERVYFANIVDTYRPLRPRAAVEVEPWDEGEPSPDPLNLAHRNTNYGAVNPEMVRLWTWKVVDVGTASAVIPPTSNYLYYLISQEDNAEILSMPAFSGEIVRSASTERAILICAPSASDESISRMNIYRLSSNTPLTQIRFNGSASLAATNNKTYMVVQGVVEYHGKIYYPKDLIHTAADTDSGVPVTHSNVLFNSFYGASSVRGHHGSHGDPILLDVTDIYPGGAGPYFEYIGTLEPEDEGIFLDDDKPSLGRMPVAQLDDSTERIESGLRWSEPYYPNRIKLSSLTEIRAGDGDQITGLEALYGNLIVLKERSMHRLAVQSDDPPISRVDEISNTIGCIAPNTVLCINNELFFLSWSGFYRYNNNELQKLDGAFAEELQLRLRDVERGTPNPAIRDASCAWNPTYREIMLNIPVMTAPNDENADTLTITDNMGERTVRGHIYAINIDTGMVTKYRYMNNSLYFTDPTRAADTNITELGYARAPRTFGRIYANNSLGQLRSAEILPPLTTDPYEVDLAEELRSRQYLHSDLFIESPTKAPVTDEDKPDDDYLYYEEVSPGVSVISSGSRNVRTYWRSKTWTANDKTVLKRIRNVRVYIAESDDTLIIRGLAHTSPEGSTINLGSTWEHQYPDTTVGPGPYYPSVVGEIMAVPVERPVNIAANRGERYTFEVEGGGAFQMEAFAFYWRPINQYER